MSDVPLHPAPADPHPEDEEGKPQRRHGLSLSEKERRDLLVVNDYAHDANGQRIGGVARPKAQK